MGVISGLNLGEGGESEREREKGNGKGSEKGGEFGDDKKGQEVIRVNEPKPLPGLDIYYYIYLFMCV